MNFAGASAVMYAGLDVALRFSPLIEGYVDFDVLSAVRCDKILVEFLRTNQFIKKWFDINYSEYTLGQDGFNHLPLEKKKALRGLALFDQGCNDHIFLMQLTFRHVDTCSGVSKEFAVFAVLKTSIIGIFLCNRTMIDLFGTAIADIWRFIQTVTAFSFEIFSNLSRTSPKGWLRTDLWLGI